jgi:hypothetical protein
MPVSADRNYVRMLHKQQVVSPATGLPFVGDTMLDRQGLGIRHAPEVLHDTDACFRH